MLNLDLNLLRLQTAQYTKAIDIPLLKVILPVDCRIKSLAFSFWKSNLFNWLEMKMHIIQSMSGLCNG